MGTALATRVRGVVLLSAAIAAVPVMAADGAWTLLSAGSATGNWNGTETGNWSAGQVAGGIDAIARFELDITAASTITLTEPRTVGQLVFADTNTATAVNWTLARTSTNTLTLAGTAPSIAVNHLFGAIWSPRIVTISAPIAGTAGLTKSGVGYLALSGTNTYTGGTSITGGVLQISNNNHIGGSSSGDVTLSGGGNLRLHGGSVANAINLAGNGTLSTNDGTGSAAFGGNLSLGSYTLTTATGSRGIDINGTLSGAGNVTAEGNGIVKLSVANPAYSGTTTLRRGTLALANDGAMGTGTFAYTVANDVTAFIRSADATGRSIANPVTITAGNGNSHTGFGSTTTGPLDFTGPVNLTSLNTSFRVYNTTTFSNSISGSGSFSMNTGLGTLILTGNNTFSGTTVTVGTGTLLVNNAAGSGTGSSNVNVTGGTLGGDGAISGAVSIQSAGTLSPGASTGILNIGSLTMAGNLLAEANSPAVGTGYDQLDITGTVALGGNLTFTLGYAPAAGDAFTLINNDGTDAVTSTFALVNGAAPTLVSPGLYSFETTYNSQAYTLNFSYAGGDGNDVVISAVPEPTTTAMAAAVTGLVLLRRRTRVNRQR